MLNAWGVVPVRAGKMLGGIEAKDSMILMITDIKKADEENI